MDTNLNADRESAIINPTDADLHQQASPNQEQSAAVKRAKNTKRPKSENDGLLKIIDANLRASTKPSKAASPSIAKASAPVPTILDEAVKPIAQQVVTEPDATTLDPSIVAQNDPEGHSNAVPTISTVTEEPTHARAAQAIAKPDLIGQDLGYRLGKVPLDDIMPSTDASPLCAKTVNDLTANIEAHGLFQALIVDDKLVLIAGRHRREALLKLKAEKPDIFLKLFPDGIDVHIREFDASVNAEKAVTVLIGASHVAHKASKDEVRALHQKLVGMTGYTGKRGRPAAGETSMLDTLAQRFGVTKRSIQRFLKEEKSSDAVATGQPKAARQAKPVREETALSVTEPATIVDTLAQLQSGFSKLTLDEQVEFSIWVSDQQKSNVELGEAIERHTSR